MISSALLLQFAVSGLGVGCVYGLVGIGLCLIYNASGIINFAQGAFVMLGGMLTSFFLHGLQLPYPLAAALAVCCVSVVGILIELIVVRPLWRRKTALFVIILATLAAQIVIERAVLLVFGDQPRALPSFVNWPPLMVAGVAVNFQMIWIVAGSVVFVAALMAFFAATRPGRAMRACAVNAEAASLLGVPVSRMLSYGIS